MVVGHSLYCPRLLWTAVLVLVSGNVQEDPVEERWPIYEKILGLQDTWHPSGRPEINSADDERLLQFMSREFLSQGMETAKVIAVSGHKQVLEDDPEISTPESNNNTFTWSGPSGVHDYAGQRPEGHIAGTCMSEPYDDG
jgi:hypothetical protein